MKRVLIPEWLDHLPAEDPRVARSRRDLLRLNRLNRSAARMADLLLQSAGAKPPDSLTDLGSGDGKFCLDVAERMVAVWPKMEVALVDQAPVVTGETLAGFRRLGWSAKIQRADLLGNHDWLMDGGRHVFMANLVLHHFPAEWLRGLFQKLAQNAVAFVALEPRRGWAQMAISWSLGLLGCGCVSRHDGPASVRGSFSAQELIELWPEPHRWELKEFDAGPFSHVFVARRRAA